MKRFSKMAGRFSKALRLRYLERKREHREEQEREMEIYYARKAEQNRETQAMYWEDLE